MSCREKLLRCVDRRFKSVQVPGGETFTIRSLTEKERSDHELRIIDRKTSKVQVSKLPEAKLRMVAACVVDDDTKEPVIQSDEWKMLEPLDSAIVACLYAACLKHNGFEDAEVEELVGNSG